MKQWYQVKEQSAGEKRLLFTWYLYKLFGKGALNAVTFIVTFFTFIFAKEIRGYSKKYLSVIEPYTGLKPSLINQFRHFLSYSFTLADRVEIFSNNFDKNKLKFSTPAVKDEIYSYFEKDKKAFFLCSHVGNTEVMRTMFINNTENPNINVNIFLSKNQCKIFNGFIKKIAVKTPIITYAVEETGVDTAIRLKDNLDNGGIAFIAGDRVAQNTNASVFEAELFGEKVYFPSGSFKLAELMEVPIYFIAALKDKKDTYTVYLEKHEFTSLENLETSYVKFIEQMTLKAPLQFYHFYDLFKDLL